MYSSKGFTLIELMIVVAIIGVLAMIALPAYKDYAIRAKVTNVIQLSRTIQDRAIDYYVTNGKFPSDEEMKDTALDPNDSDILGVVRYSHDYNGYSPIIFISFDDKIFGQGDYYKNYLLLTIEDKEGSIQAKCVWNAYIPLQWLPANCRETLEVNWAP